MNSFDPDAPAPSGSLFGLPFTTDNAKIVVLPVPWDVTVSYKSGASKGPQAILNASCQVDLFDEKIKDAWRTGIAIDEFPHKLAKKNKKLRKKAEKYIELVVSGQSSVVSRKVEGKSKQWMKSRKK